MASCNGPKLNTTNLLYTQQPGVITRHMTTGGTTFSYAAGATVSAYKSVSGAQRNNDSNYAISTWPASTQAIDQLTNSIYVCPDGVTSTIGNTYSISIWIKIKHFGTTLGTNTHSRHAKKSSLVRFNYKDKGSGSTRDGFIEFGALGPYYRNINDSTNAYKFVFEPFSLGVALRTADRTNSISTDFIYYFNTWYLVTLELSGGDDLSTTTVVDTYAKLYVNGELKSCAPYWGIPWAGSGTSKMLTGSRRYVPRRVNSRVISQPGFINTVTGSAIGSASSNSWQHGKWLSLDKLNYISFSPVSRINRKYAETGSNPLGSTPGANNGINTPTITEPMKYSQSFSSWVEFGQFYIYNREFDINIYNNFKYLYS